MCVSFTDGNVRNDSVRNCGTGSPLAADRLGIRINPPTPFRRRNCGSAQAFAIVAGIEKWLGASGLVPYLLASSFTIVSTILSIASVTRLAGKLKLLERMEKARWSPLAVVA